MNVLLEAAKEVCDFMAERRWQFCVIGGLAVQQWGEPRTTLDADISLLAGWGEEERFVADLLKRFQSRVSGAHDFAAANRVLLLRATNGREIDVALGALPFEEEMVKRAVRVEMEPGVTLPCCTAEDLLVMKAFAGRDRDWLDVQGIVSRQKSLATEYVLTQLSSLCEMSESSEALKRVEQLFGEST